MYTHTHGSNVWVCVHISTHASGSHTHTMRFPALTGVRGLAALYVFVFHYGEIGCDDVSWLLAQNGRVAVSMFFCLSGFLMTHTYGHCAMASRDCVLSFWWKRVARLMPAYYASLLLSVHDVQCVWSDGGCGAWKWVDMAMHALGVGTWMPFRPNSSHWNLVAWSVQTEMGFYLMFPLLSRAMRRGHWWLWVAGAVACTTLPSVIIIGVLGETGWWALYAMPWTRVGEFALGMLVAARYSNIRTIEWRDIDAVIVCILVVCAGVLDANWCAYGLLAVPLCAFLVMCTKETTLVARVLSHPTAVHAGEISYCFYLVHLVWPGLGEVLGYASDAGANLAAMYFLLSLSAGALLHRYVEVPAYDAAMRVTTTRCVCEKTTCVHPVTV